MSETAGGYEVASARERDLDAVIAMVNAADMAVGVVPDATREFLTWLWHIPATDLERDTRVVRRDGAVVGFAQSTWRPNEGGPLGLFLCVHPDHRRADVDAGLVAWAESLAEERGAEGVRASVPDLDRDAQDLLRSRGYHHVRSFFTMSKPLRPGEDAGPVPAEVTLRSYQEADARTLFEVHEASFADHWGFRPSSYEDFIGELQAEDWDPSLVFLADVDGQAVGHVVGFKFATEGFVAILGVLGPWRGRGIAKALLRRSFAEMAGRGLPQVSLGVDARNPHGAVALYEGVGMTVRRREETFDLGTDEVAT